MEGPHAFFPMPAVKNPRHHNHGLNPREAREARGQVIWGRIAADRRGPGVRRVLQMALAGFSVGVALGLLTGLGAVAGFEVRCWAP
ncbi:hypothetical protein C2857_004236 [Epichloe festucae Fl1]|uniref:Uncharacterized protein n=1 Tax=Epichloe festucae (strain Fl1) TaxID=877507 RepID=A0A7S9KV12_EPIFF|nr:hypothetical protein C2857_004236 [Epichloe festucae Fl1]